MDQQKKKRLQNNYDTNKNITNKDLLIQVKNELKTNRITKEVVELLCDKKGRELINLSNPSSPTGPNHQGTMTFACHCGNVITTRVRAYFQCVDGCINCTKKVTDSEIKEKVSEIRKSEPEISRSELVKRLGVDKRRLSGVAQLPKGPLNAPLPVKSEAYYKVTPAQRQRIRQVAFMHNYEPPRCFCCDLITWRGFSIEQVGDIDHIDGNSQNNFIDNLRVLCRNCHAHTKTRYQFLRDKLDKKGPIYQINIIIAESEITHSKHINDRLILQGVIPRKREGSNKYELDKILRGEILGYRNVDLGDRLIGEKLKEPKCNCCKITKWRGIPMRLFLDLHHIDHNKNNNDLDNLELLCKNCHKTKHLDKGDLI